MNRKILSIILTLSMLLSMLPVTVWAAGVDPDTGLCPHHTEHTEECGYIPTSEGAPCAHEHTDDCYTAVTSCVHVHTDSCYSIAADTELITLEDQESVEDAGADTCGHICTVESGCVTLVLECVHEHDEACGYTEPVEGVPCGYVCDICNGAAEVQSMIDALPTVEEVRAMDTDGQRTVYDQTQTAYDAYMALSEEQRGFVTGAEAFEKLFAFFNRQTMPLVTASVSYVNAQGQSQGNVTATVVESSTTTWSDSTTSGWYVVNNNVTISNRITVSGTVNLILADGYTLTANSGINVATENSLTIWGQSEDSGSLIATGSQYNAGIGANMASWVAYSNGSITINGGQINVKGGQDGGAGIGGSAAGDGRKGGTGQNITINGGVVEATGGSSTSDSGAGAGIGGGGGAGEGANGGACDNITINGGTVIATGGTGFVGFKYGAGIGGGSYGGSGSYQNGTTSNININGGTIIAQSGYMAIGTAPTFGINYDHLTYGNTSNEESDEIQSSPSWSTLRWVRIIPYSTGNLTISPPAFSEVEYGYAQPAAQQISFSGNPYIQNVTISGSDFTLSGSGSSWTVQPKEGLSVGTHTATITATYLKGDTTTTATETVSFTVSPKNISGASISLERESFTYNGSSQTVNVTSATVGGMTLTADDYTISGNSGTDANSYTLTLSGKGNFTGTATKTWSIGKATPDASMFTYTPPTDLTYNGNPKEATVVLRSPYTKAGTITVKYNDNTTEPVNAGTYPVTIDVAGGDNFNAASGIQMGTFTISKARLEVTPPTAKQGLIYNGEAQYLLDNGGATTAGTLKYSLTDGNNYSDAIPQGTNADSYTVYYKVEVNDNYEDVTGSVTVNIAPAPVSFTVSDATHSYDGSSKQASVTPDAGALTFTESDYSVTYQKQGESGNVEPKDMGKYDIWVQLNNTNFKFEGTDERQMSIGVLEIVGGVYPEQEKITWPDATGITYGDTLEQSALENGSTASAGGAGTFAWKEKDTIPTVTNSGYTVVFTPSDANYAPVEHIIPIQVAKKDLNVTEATAIGRSYEPDNFGVAISGGELVGVITRNGKPDDVSLVTVAAKGTVTTPDAGENKAVTVTGYALDGADKDNYNLIQPTNITVTITKADQDAPDGEIKVTKSAESITVTSLIGEQYEYYVGTNAPGNDEDWLNVREFTSLDSAIEYTVYVRLKGSDNYNPSGYVTKTVITSAEGGSTTLKPGETVETEEGGSVTNDGDKITMDDGSGNTTTVTPPEGKDFNDGVEVDGNGNVTVPDGSAVTPPGGPDITVGPDNSGTVDEDGNITLPESGSAQVGDTTVTVPEGGGTLEPNGKGGVEVPDGSTVTPPGGPDIAVGPDNGGTVDEDGNVTLPGGGSAKIGDATVTVPEAGGTLEPNGDGLVNVPPGSKVTDKDGKEHTVPSQGGKIGSDGSYTDNPSSGGSTGGGSGGGGYVSTYTVTVSQAEHGKVTVSPTSAASGRTVTITVAPNEGYELSKLIVTDSRGNELTLTDKGNGTYTFTMPSRAVTVTATFALIQPEVCDGGPDCPGYSFTDLDAHAWYHEAVDYAIRHGLMNGYGNGIFAPGDDLSRAMLAEILFRLEGSIPANYLMQYDDVPTDTWYTEAIRWATSEGIVHGYGNGAFGPNDPITREQLAVMLYRYEQSKGGGFTGAWMFRLDFTDVVNVSDWAYEAICWCSMNGIVVGKGDGIFDPKGKATRAEVAAMLMRYLRLKK